MKATITKDQLALSEIGNNNSGSVNYYEIETEFDSTWDDLTKKVILSSDSGAIERSVINNKVYVDKDTEGLYAVGFVGYTIVNNVKTYQISTNLVPIVIRKGAGEITTSSETVPTPSQWEIYIAQIQAMIDELEEEIPTKTSDLTNDSGFITNAVNDLVNYYLKTELYTKTETYTKTEVNNLISQIQKVTIEIVQTLPATGQSNVIYFVPKTSDDNDAYNEYIYINNQWELIGNTDVDLSNYYDKTETDALLGNKVDKITGKGLSTNDYTTEEKTKLAGIDMSTKQDVMQYATMPTADATNVNKIVEYVGTTGTYTNGYFYKNVNTQVQESITAEETDNLGLLSDININATTFKSKVNGGGTYVFVKKGYPTKLTYMNLNTMTTYSVTRDTIFDNAMLGIYSWVDNSNQYYVTNTLRPNAGTKLYSYDITTQETTDTGASYLNSSVPSTTSGYWTIQTSANVYEDADLSEYGITMATTGFPGNEITVTYVEASNTYAWTQWNVQPAGSAEIDYFTVVDGKLNIVYEEEEN